MLVSRRTAALFISGDQRAAAEVYQAYRRLLFFIIGSILSDQEEAEDVFQDAFYKVMEKRQEIRKPEGLHYYLCQTAKNLALSRAKEKAREVSYETFFSSAEEPAEESEPNSFLADLASYITAEEDTVVTLKIVYGCSLKEIASLAEKPLTTVESIYQRGVKKIRKHLKEQ